MTKVFTDGLSFALPLLIMAVGAIYSEKSGVTNLAIEGFQGFGAFVGALVAILIMPYLPKSSQIPIYVAMLFAAIGGGIYACVHALLCINFKANQVISGVVVNILAVALTTFFTSSANTALLGTAFEWIIIGLVIVFWYLMYRTRYGMRLRACGENPQALDAAGGDVVKTRWIAVIISGALSGIGGICFAYSIMANYSPSIYMGYGYLAIAAMIFGNWNIPTTVLVCLVFGIAKAGGQQLCIAMKLSGNYTDLFNMLPYILTMLLLIFFSRRNHPPQACGQPWDHSRR